MSKRIAILALKGKIEKTQLLSVFGCKSSGKIGHIQEIT